MVRVPLGLLMLCNPRSLPGVRPRPKSRVTLAGPLRSAMFFLPKCNGCRSSIPAGEAFTAILRWAHSEASNALRQNHGDSEKSASPLLGDICLDDSHQSK